MGGPEPCILRDKDDEVPLDEFQVASNALGCQCHVAKSQRRTPMKKNKEKIASGIMEENGRLSERQSARVQLARPMLPKAPSM